MLRLAAHEGHKEIVKMKERLRSKVIFVIREERPFKALCAHREKSTILRRSKGKMSSLTDSSWKQILEIRRTQIIYYLKITNQLMNITNNNRETKLYLNKYKNITKIYKYIFYKYKYVQKLLRLSLS